MVHSGHNEVWRMYTKSGGVGGQTVHQESSLWTFSEMTHTLLNIMDIVFNWWYFLHFTFQRDEQAHNNSIFEVGLLWPITQATAM